MASSLQQECDKLKHDVRLVSEENAFLSLELKKSNGKVNHLEESYLQLTIAKKDQDAQLHRLHGIEQQYQQMKKEMEKLVQMQQEDLLSMQRLAALQQDAKAAEDAYTSALHQIERLTEQVKSLHHFEELYHSVWQQLESEKSQKQALEQSIKTIEELHEQDKNRLLEQTIKTLSEKIEKAERALREKEQVFNDLKFSEYKSRKKCEELSQVVQEKDILIDKLKRELKQVSKKEDVSKIMLIMDGESEGFNEILLQELRMMREAFEQKLVKANQEVELIKHAHETQLAELHQTIKMERQLMGKKMEKLKDKCNVLETKLKQYER